MMMVIGTPSSHSKIGSIVSLLIIKLAIEEPPANTRNARSALLGPLGVSPTDRT